MEKWLLENEMNSKAFAFSILTVSSFDVIAVRIEIANSSESLSPNKH